MPGGRPPGAPNKERPFRDALRRVAYEDNRAALDKAARALIKSAHQGDTAAVRELADRLDGKVPQAITGDDDGDPIRHIVTWEKDDE
jgi:hypothetical protein